MYDITLLQKNIRAQSLLGTVELIKLTSYHVSQTRIAPCVKFPIIIHKI